MYYNAGVEVVNSEVGGLAPGHPAAVRNLPLITSASLASTAAGGASFAASAPPVTCSGSGSASFDWRKKVKPSELWTHVAAVSITLKGSR
jgi:hypothetical protein